MPKASKATATRVEDFGAAEDRTEVFGDYSVQFVTIREDSDLKEALAGLPNDSCPCPHWGYLTAGRITVRYLNGDEETIEPGDAFYMSPGHVPKAEKGSEFVIFSPTDQIEAITAAMQANMAAKMQAAPGA